MINSLPPVCSHAIRTILMVWVRITLGFQPRVIRTQTINIFSYCMNKQGITNIMTYLGCISTYICVFRTEYMVIIKSNFNLFGLCLEVHQKTWLPHDQMMLQKVISWIVDLQIAMSWLVDFLPFTICNSYKICTCFKDVCQTHI